MWQTIEPRAYERSLQPLALFRVLLISFLLYLPGLEAMAQRYAHLLQTDQRSTLSYALRRLSFLQLAQALLERLQSQHRPQPGQLLALDSMPLTLPSSRRHGCRRINATTVGGGVLWSFMIDAARGTCPIKILRLIVGPWRDSQLVAELQLLAHGPIYLMDRGFWAIDLVNQWLQQQVHFIVRITSQDFKFTPLRTCGGPRTLAGGIRITFDGVARLGGPQRRRKPLVRLVYAYLPNGDDLILASDLLDWSAQELLAAYRKRWQIERFHRFLKETVGLAHLYSFQEAGLFLLLHLAVMLAVLLWLSLAAPKGLTVTQLLLAIAQMRRRAGVPQRWRPNTTRPPRQKKADTATGTCLEV